MTLQRSRALPPRPARPRRAVSRLGDEARLVRDLRAALPIEAQAVFFRQFDELLALLAEPRCAECQADGVPCPHLGTACDECARAAAWVHDLREAIARSST